MVADITVAECFADLQSDVSQDLLIRLCHLLETQRAAGFDHMSGSLPDVKLYVEFEFAQAHWA